MFGHLKEPGNVLETILKLTYGTIQSFILQPFIYVIISSQSHFQQFKNKIIIIKEEEGGKKKKKDRLAKKKNNNGGLERKKGVGEGERIPKRRPRVPELRLIHFRVLKREVAITRADEK
ncbi:hypothetical protein CEXT_485461 [Caerostris extrusa]|uniref:Uncharacterized protein n=1 Tax=Caerostris extrusa TaxID=172846 RepID=A0AAV4Y124_CAEEX|nr:hypothetical protein CEXT_485461 [Caerostris extrusa]